MGARKVADERNVFYTRLYGLVAATRATEITRVTTALDANGSARSASYRTALAYHGRLRQRAVGRYLQLDAQSKPLVNRLHFLHTGGEALAPVGFTLSAMMFQHVHCLSHDCSRATALRKLAA